jgi:hypothetical protein
MSDIKRLKQCVDEIKKFYPKAWGVSGNIRATANSKDPIITITLYLNDTNGDYPQYYFESVKELQDWVDHLKSKPRQILFRQFSLNS